jgi:hypothetical protein
MGPPRRAPEADGEQTPGSAIRDGDGRNRPSGPRGPDAAEAHDHGRGADPVTAELRLSCETTPRPAPLRRARDAVVHRPCMSYAMERRGYGCCGLVARPCPEARAERRGMGAAPAHAAGSSPHRPAAKGRPNRHRRAAVAGENRRALARPARTLRSVAQHRHAGSTAGPGRGCGGASFRPYGASRMHGAGSTGRSTWSMRRACAPTGTRPAPGGSTGRRSAARVAASVASCTCAATGAADRWRSC